MSGLCFTRNGYGAWWNTYTFEVCLKKYDKNSSQGYRNRCLSSFFSNLISYSSSSLIRPTLLPWKSGLIKWMTALDRDSILLFQSGLSIRGSTRYFYLPKKVLYKILMNFFQILIKSTACKQWSTLVDLKILKALLSASEIWAYKRGSVWWERNWHDYCISFILLYTPDRFYTISTFRN